MHRKLPQFLAGIAACMGSVAVGTVLGWTANLDSKIKEGGLNGVTFDKEDGWVGSSATIGAAIMCLLTGKFCDWFGRKTTMIMMMVPMLAGWAVIITMQERIMMYVGRFLTGLAGGAFCVAAPMYTSEIAEVEIRGTLGNFFQLFLTIGILYVQVLGAFCDVLLATQLCMIMPIIFLLLFTWQPESPFHTLKKGNEEKTKKNLQYLRGGDGADIGADFSEIQKTAANNVGNCSDFMAAFEKRNTKMATMISFTLMFFQQMCGINVVIFYAGTVFESCSTFEPHYSTILIGVIQVVATLLSTAYIDVLGRKYFLCLSGALMAISLVALGMFFILWKDELANHGKVEFGWLPVVSLCVFILGFSFGFGPIPWMISGEIFGQEVKSILSSLAGTFNWLLAFLIVSTYPLMANRLGGGPVFLFFACVSFLSIVFVVLVVPETKGKTFAEIQKDLGGD